MYGGRRTVDLGAARARALLGVVAVHGLLGAALISGLAMRGALPVDEALKTFNIPLELPPPPLAPEPEPQPEQAAAREDPAPPAPKADPLPTEAPKPVIPLPVAPAAPAAGSGTMTSSGAASEGSGTGAGGSGFGSGGGGSGGSPSPAVLISDRFRRSSDRSFAPGMPSGRARMQLKIGADGIPENCRTANSSGDPAVDSALCRRLVSALRFRPARTADGRAIAQDIFYVATWGPR